MVQTLIDGKSLEDVKVYTSKMPNLPSAQRDVVTTDVQGRVHGALTRKYGWKDATISIPLTYYDFNNLQQIKRELTPIIQNGKQLSFSNDNQYYLLLKQADLSEVSPGEIEVVGELTIEATVDPFQYLITKTETHTETFDLDNPSSMEASPLITIHGSGHVELVINSETIGINNVVDQVTIDSRLFTCYSSTTNFDNKMTGDYPTLKSGQNTIQFGTGVTSVEIDPRWCWLL